MTGSRRSNLLSLSFGLLALAQASPCTAKIEWGDCPEGEFNTTLPIDCGSLPVPLDYTQSNASETLNLEILRLSAAQQPSSGSIFLNFGGPGAEARQSLVALGSLLLELSGNAYDLLAIDPRGVAKESKFVCTEDLSQILTMLDGYAVETTSEANARLQWARGKVDSNICINNAGELSELVGTAFVVRDMISVVDALDEDGMLRFWGLSYGTTLGATAASMFPERIDRMIIDGVQNPHEYYHAHADFEEWTDSDDAFSSIFIKCEEAGFPACPLAAGNATAQEMEDAIWDLLDSLVEQPRPAGEALLTAYQLRSGIIGSVKTWGNWADLTLNLAVLLSGNETAIAESVELWDQMSRGVDALPTALQPLEGLYAIHCSDRIPRAETFEEIEPAFDLLLNRSRLTGPSVSSITARCAQWGAHAREIYDGDFHVQTAHPLLVIGNTLDAHTPLKSAYNVSSGFEGSEVLEINGTGHCATALPSVCSARTMIEYWVNGELPKPGTVCDVEAQPFTGLTWADVLEELHAGNGDSNEKRSLSFPREMYESAHLFSRNFGLF